MPVSHCYNKADGKIYFHSAKTRHKIDAGKDCSKVSFCVMGQGYTKGDEWALNIKRLIVFRKADE